MFMANIEFTLPYSQRYLVLGLVGLALSSHAGIALNEYRCEYGAVNSMFAINISFHFRFLMYEIINSIIG